MEWKPSDADLEGDRLQSWRAKHGLACRAGDEDARCEDCDVPMIVLAGETIGLLISRDEHEEAARAGIVPTVTRFLCSECFALLAAQHA